MLYRRENVPMQPEKTAMTTENDDALARIADLPRAFALLTRLPVPQADAARAGAAAWAYPVVGLALGALAALAGALALGLGLPAPLAALIALAALVLMTGAMHEDGLADCADGFWGGWTPARRLEIMKDSRIGSYGVIALVLSLTARWAALWLLFEGGAGAGAAALMAAGAASRAAMPALMATLPHARDEGLSRSVGTVSARTACLAAGLALGSALLLTGWSALPALFWVVVLSIAMAHLAQAKINGQTGDILGAAQQIAEIAVLFSLVA